MGNVTSPGRSVSLGHDFPEHIEPFKWAESGFVWQGRVPLSRFPRLLADVAGDASQIALDVLCRLSLDDRRLAWLDAEIAGDLPLSCQRCLEPLPYRLTSHSHVALLRDERQLARLGSERDEVDYVLVSEEYGDPDAELDLLELLEDEILLSMPMTFRHEDCELKAGHVVIEEAPAEDEPRHNPFGVLAGLKLNDRDA